MKNKIAWDVIVFSFIGVLIILLLPSLIQRPSLCSFFDYTIGKDVGSTIGGISGPFVSLISAILVYVAFKEQKRATDSINEKESIKVIYDILHGLEEKSIDGLFQKSFDSIEVIYTLLVKNNANNKLENVDDYSLHDIIIVDYLINSFINLNSLANELNANKQYVNNRIRSTYVSLFKLQIQLAFDRIEYKYIKLALFNYLEDRKEVLESLDRNYRVLKNIYN